MRPADSVVRCGSEADELVAENYVDHNPPPFPGLASGREGLKEAFRIFQKATPGYHHIEEQIADGESACHRLRKPDGSIRSPIRRRICCATALNSSTRRS